MATNARPRISAALVTRRPVRPIPSTTAVVGRAGAVVRLAHPAEDEHLVVHRDAEQEREDDDRHLDVDRARRLDAPDRLGSEAVLPDEDHQPPGGADRQQVQQDGLERQDQRAERARQQDERERGDQRDDEREVAVDGVEEVGALRGLAAGHDVGGQRAGRCADAVERRAARRASCRPAVGMTVTSAVPSRRQSVGATAARTPSTPPQRVGDGVGIARADERVERRQRAGADAGVGELVEARARRAGLGQRVGARVAELDRRRGDDERAEHGGRERRPRPSGGARRCGPRPTSRGWRDPRVRCGAGRAAGRSWPGRPAAG